MGHIGYNALRELLNTVKEVEKVLEIKNIDYNIYI
jgi:hypothetical protein